MSRRVERLPSSPPQGNHPKRTLLSAHIGSVLLWIVSPAAIIWFTNTQIADMTLSELAILVLGPFLSLYGLMRYRKIAKVSGVSEDEESQYKMLIKIPVFVGAVFALTAGLPIFDLPLLLEYIMAHTTGIFVSLLQFPLIRYGAHRESREVTLTEQIRYVLSIGVRILIFHRRWSRLYSALLVVSVVVGLLRLAGVVTQTAPDRFITVWSGLSAIALAIHIAGDIGAMVSFKREFGGWLRIDKGEVRKVIPPTIMLLAKQAVVLTITLPFAVWGGTLVSGLAPLTAQIPPVVTSYVSLAGAIGHMWGVTLLAYGVIGYFKDFPSIDDLLGIKLAFYLTDKGYDPDEVTQMISLLVETPDESGAAVRKETWTDITAGSDEWVWDVDPAHIRKDVEQARWPTDGLHFPIEEAVTDKGITGALLAVVGLPIAVLTSEVPLVIVAGVELAVIVIAVITGALMLSTAEEKQVYIKW